MLYLYFTLFQRQILYFLVNSICLIALVTSYCAAKISNKKNKKLWSNIMNEAKTSFNMNASVIII